MKLFAVVTFAISALFQVQTAWGGLIISRSAEITPSTSQVVDGMFGSGFFWRPEYTLNNPFTINEGDTIEVTLFFTDNIRVTVNAGSIEQESIMAFLGVPGGSGMQKTRANAVWEFLDVQGDLFNSTFVATDVGQEGVGISAGWGTRDLTDTSFSFGGIRYSIEIIEDVIGGLPASFEGGLISIQTQGDFEFMPVPEPSTLTLLGIGVASFFGYGWRRKRTMA